MKAMLPRFIVACGILIVALGQVQAQIQVIPSAQQLNPVNPYFRVSPGISVGQWLANQRATGSAIRSYPPWAFGFNPYPSPVINSGPIVGNPWSSPAASPFFGGGVNPYSPAMGMSNPYTAAAGGGIPGANPYTPGVVPPSYFSNAYNSFNPWGFPDPNAGALFGTASVMQALGNNILNVEQARTMREQALQARLETKKKAFDLDLYIKANTPTFTEEQAKIAKSTLKRIQTQSNPAEIYSGKSINYVLNDLRQYPTRKISMEPIQLSEDILRQINVTQSFGNLGLLRNDGRFTWPPALQEIVAAGEQKEIEIQAQRLITQAMNGKVDANILRDLRGQVDRIRDQLAKRVNDIPTTQYIEAKRFLNDFDDARVGLERGDAVPYFNFQKFVSSGKSVQEVVEYLVASGLKVAPAVLGEEAAYQALFSAMAAYDVALNTQVAPSFSATKD